jgi:deoxyribodipyrimidine photo-lyase
VSGLSPYIRHRLLSEIEVLTAVLAQHSRSASEKFIQEVFWRGYWKGWLEQRPSVWSDYLDDLGRAGSALVTDADLSARYQAAVDGETGILPLDSWSRELVQTGYLHNHARMWFASIWIFTLKLPWVLGADFFLRHLLDGDPASNTLSWRWVAGLHTRGKTYLATERNIRRYAAERFDLDAAGVGFERLSAEAAALEAPANPAPSPIAWPVRPEPLSRSGVLLTEEDLLIDLPVEPLALTALRIDTDVCPLVHQFKTGAIENALAQAAAELPGADISLQSASAYEVVAWAQQNRLDQVWVAYAPVGYVRSRLEALEVSLGEVGVSLVPFVREYDRLVWPHCSKGFFQLRKRIPELLDALAEGESGALQVPAEGF